MYGFRPVYKLACLQIPAFYMCNVQTLREQRKKNTRFENFIV